MLAERRIRLRRLRYIRVDEEIQVRPHRKHTSSKNKRSIKKRESVLLRGCFRLLLVRDESLWQLLDHERKFDLEAGL